MCQSPGGKTQIDKTLVPLQLALTQFFCKKNTRLTGIKKLSGNL